MTTTIGDRRHEQAPIPPENDRRSGEERRHNHVQCLVIIADTKAFEDDVALYGEVTEYAREEFGCEVHLIMKGDEEAFKKFPFRPENVVYLADFRGNAETQEWVFQYFEAARSLEVTTLALYSGKGGMPRFYFTNIAAADSKMAQQIRHDLRNLIQLVPDDFKTVELIKAAIAATFSSLRGLNESAAA